jgi:hypothetical protein
MSEHHGATHDDGFGDTTGVRAAGRLTLTEPDIDAAIDAVAREMMTLEPPSAFRASVMDRIGLQPTPRGPEWWVLTAPRGAWAAAAVVLVLMAATGVWIERGEILPAQGGMASLTVAPLSPPNPPAGQARPSDGLSANAGREAALAAPSAQFRRSAVRVGAASQVRTTDDDVEIVPALAELEALQFTNIGPDALDIPAIEVAPLPTIPSLDIPSLHLDSTDTRSTDPKKEN